MSQSNLQTDQARARWAAEYREARKQARFIETFHAPLRALEPSQRTFPNQCRGFSFTRLSGDHLRLLCRPTLIVRKSTFACCRLEPTPRLPA